MADFTLIRPANDAAALELSNWCAALIPTIQANHSIAHDLYAGAATRTSVDTALKGVRCILFFGHGKDAELLGASGALVDTVNAGFAQGAILIAIACSSAKVLGPDAVHHGVSAYLGFKDRFVWISRDPDHQFEAAATAGISRLLASDEIGAALGEMQAYFRSAVLYYLNGTGRTSPNRAIGWLAAFWDLQHLELQGTDSARL
jgi:hypothetical protein